MAVEILQVADRRAGLPTAHTDHVTLAQYRRDAPPGWQVREVTVAERPAAASVVVPTG